MKTVTMNKEEYESCYLACATGPTEDWKETRTLSKVLDKLEKAGDKRDQEKGGGFTLKREDHEFKFEDEEAEFMVERMRLFLPKIHGWAGVRFLPIVEQLEADSITLEE